MRGLLRVLLSGIAGAVAWALGIAVVFGPAQVLLADSTLQSAKFLAAFTQEPLPRIATQPVAFAAGLVAIACVYAIVYDWIAPRLPGGVFWRGLAFGWIAWALMVPWFEFYLPWNVMHEPLPLVLLESVCWFVVLEGVALAIAFVHARLAPP